jgi:hypothetical protein
VNDKEGNQRSIVPKRGLNVNKMYQRAREMKVMTGKGEKLRQKGS